MWDSIADVLPVAALLVDARGHVLAANAAAEAFLDQPASELIGKPLALVAGLPPTVTQGALEFSTERELEGEVQGRRVTVRLSTRSFPAAALLTPGLAPATRPSQFLAALPDAALVTDAHGQLLSFGRAPSGRTAHLGDSVLAWVTPARRGELSAALLRAASGASNALVVTSLEQRVWRCRTFPVRRGIQNAAGLLIADITLPFLLDRLDGAVPSALARATAGETLHDALEPLCHAVRPMLSIAARHHSDGAEAPWALIGHYDAGDLELSWGLHEPPPDSQRLYLDPDGAALGAWRLGQPPTLDLVAWRRGSVLTPAEAQTVAQTVVELAAELVSLANRAPARLINQASARLTARCRTTLQSAKTADELISGLLLTWVEEGCLAEARFEPSDDINAPQSLALCPPEPPAISPAPTVRRFSFVVEGRALGAFVVLGPAGQGGCACPAFEETTAQAAHRLAALWREAELAQIQEALSQSLRHLAAVGRARRSVFYEHTPDFSHFQGGGLAELLELDEPPPETAQVIWWVERVHPADRAGLRQAFEDIRMGKSQRYRQTVRVRLRAGHYAHVELQALTVERPEGRVFLGMALEITEAAQATQALETSRARLSLLTEDASSASLVLDGQGNVRFLGPSAPGDGLGLTPDLVLDQPLSLICHPDDRPQLSLALEETLAAAGAHTRWPAIRFRHRDGLWHTLVGLASAQLDVPGVLGVVVVTERLKAEQLRDLLAAAVEQGTEAVAVTDARGVLTYGNPALEVLTGQRLEALQGELLPALKPEAFDDPKVYKNLMATLAEGRVWQDRRTRKRADGQLYMEHSAIAPIRDAQGELVRLVVVARNVSEEAALEQALRQAQKMEAVGRLAGGISHDFSNLLTAILGNLDFCQASELSDDVRADLEEAAHAAQRASDLTRQLQVFSQQSPLSPKVVALDQAIRDLEGMLKRVIREDIEYRCHLNAPQARVLATPDQLGQVVVNLIVNAVDALPDGGLLTLETHVTREGDADWVQLSVSDTGVGMSTDVLEHIFEPFFTTKRTGKGTGLGLAIVHGVVHQVGGWIEARSIPGQGSHFVVGLPQTTRPLVRERPAAETPLRGGQESVLVVEDDDLVRAVARRALQGLGYKVTVAAGALEALRLARSAPPDLVLTDLVMPGMSGYELLDTLKDQHPDTKVLLMSGYPRQAGNERLSEAQVFLEKPFTRQTLAEAVRLALDPAPLTPIPQRVVVD